MGDLAGLIVCPICREATGVGITKRLDKSVPPEIEDAEPCEKCRYKVLIMFDADTKEFIGYAKREVVLNDEALKEYRKQDLAISVRETKDGMEIIPTNKEGKIFGD